MGLMGLGRFVALVPHSIVVGFTIGIAVTIALSQVGEVLGLKAKIGYSFLDKCRDIAANLHEFNAFALLLAAGTFVVIKYLLKVSIYIPAPLIAIGVGTLLCATLLADQGLTLVKTKYGRIPTDFWSSPRRGCRAPVPRSVTTSPTSCCRSCTSPCCSTSLTSPRPSSSWRRSRACSARAWPTGWRTTAGSRSTRTRSSGARAGSTSWSRC